MGLEYLPLNTVSSQESRGHRGTPMPVLTLAVARAGGALPDPEPG